MWLLGAYLTEDIIEPEPDYPFIEEDTDSSGLIKDLLISLGITMAIVGIVWLGVDLYCSYQTTLNYIDPAIKPLYLPTYVGIPEPLPPEMTRDQIINFIDSRLLGSEDLDLLTSPASPSLMHGYWE